MMAQIDALSLRVIASQGYKNDEFSKKLFDQAPTWIKKVKRPNR